MNRQIVLASTSPFRKVLMERLEIPFKTESPLIVEEDLQKSYTGRAKDLCAYLAKQKALSLETKFENALIIGSDQSLFCENKTLGKGHNFEGAFKQLKFCSGKTATLVTSVYINDTKGEDLHFENIIDLHFKKLGDEAISKYLEWDEPYNCAGSFKFESKGCFLFERVYCNDPTAIEGLPLMELSTLLQNKGVVLKFF